MASYEADFIFIDQALRVRPWIAGGCDGKAWDTGKAITVEANGFVTAVPEGVCPHTMVLDTVGDYPTGIYTVTWEGPQNFTVEGDAKNFQVVAPNKATVNVGQATKTGIRLLLKPPFQARNFRIIMPGFDADHVFNRYVDTFPTTKAIFYPPTLERLKRYGVVRFMDWQRTNGSPVKTWAQRTTPQSFSQTTTSGVAIEYMIALANTLGADPWFTIPHMADDDFVKQMAGLVKAQLKGNLKPYVEYTNEGWNSGFTQYKWLNDQGVSAGLAPGDAHSAGRRFYSQRSVDIMRLWKAIDHRIIPVIASQAASSYLSDKLLEWKGAAKEVQALAIAPYFGHRYQKADLTLDELFADIETKSLPETYKWMSDQAAVAKKYGVQLIAYEGGQHLQSPNDAAATTLFQSANRDPRMGKYYSQYLASWKKYGSLFVHFNHVGNWTKYGSWASLEKLSQTSSPKFDALMEATQ